MMFMTLMTMGIGTTEIEENSFKLVRERTQRGSNLLKKKEFQKYSGLSKREKVSFLVENRDEKIVMKLLEVKISVVKELEKELFEEVREAWKKFEAVHLLNAKGAHGLFLGE